MGRRSEIGEVVAEINVEEIRKEAK